MPGMIVFNNGYADCLVDIDSIVIVKKTNIGPVDQRMVSIQTTSGHVMCAADFSVIQEVIKKGRTAKKFEIYEIIKK